MIKNLTPDEIEGFVVLAAKSAATSHELYTLKANLVTFFDLLRRNGRLSTWFSDGESIETAAQRLGLIPAPRGGAAS